VIRVPLKAAQERDARRRLVLRTVHFFSLATETRRTP
jgi:hypothetical protein